MAGCVRLLLASRPFSLHRSGGSFSAAPDKSRLRRLAGRELVHTVFLPKAPSPVLPTMVRGSPSKAARIIRKLEEQLVTVLAASARCHQRSWRPTARASSSRTRGRPSRHKSPAPRAGNIESLCNNETNSPSRRSNDLKSASVKRAESCGTSRAFLSHWKRIRSAVLLETRRGPKAPTHGSISLEQLRWRQVMQPRCAKRMTSSVAIIIASTSMPPCPMKRRSDRDPQRDSQ